MYILNIFIEAIVQKVDQRFEHQEIFGCTLIPAVVFEIASVAVMEFAVAFEPEQIDAGVILGPAFRSGLEFVSEPAGV